MSEGSAGRTGPRCEWFALYTRARHEKRVNERLRDLDVDAFLPLVPRLRQWHDRRKLVEFPLFPGYVFVRTSRVDMPAILGTPGVATVVSFNGRPVSIPEEEMSNVRRFAEVLARSGGQWPEPSPLIETGGRVLVKGGPFQGVEGVVLEDRGGNRALVQVGLEAIGQGIKLEVEAAYLRPI